MSDFTTMPDGRTVLRSDAERIAEWIDFAASLVTLYRAHIDKLKDATRELGRVAQDGYPQLQSGGSVDLAVADLDGLMDDFSFEFTDAYVGLTGAVLFTCVDGPMVAAETLAEQIDVLHDHVWKEGIDADHGDA